MRQKLKTIPANEFESDVRAGLGRRGQKELSAKYFYDDLGSALFEAITLLPEYGLTRADLRLLDSHVADLAALAGDASIVAELEVAREKKLDAFFPTLLAIGNWCTVRLTSHPPRWCVAGETLTIFQTSKSPRSSNLSSMVLLPRPNCEMTSRKCWCFSWAVRSETLIHPPRWIF